MTLVLDHIYQAFNFEVAWLGLYDRIHHQLLTRGCHSPRHLRSIRSILPLTAGDVMEQVIIQQRPLIVADLLNEIRAGEWGTIAKQLSLQSALLFPIKRQDVCFGVLVLASSQWGMTPSLGDRAYLSIVLGDLAEVLYHNEADQQRQQTKRFEQPFTALLAKLSTSSTIDDLLSDVVRETQRFIAPNRTRVFWFAPRGNFFWQRIPRLGRGAQRSSDITSDSTDSHGTESANLEDAGPGIDGEERIPVDDIRGLYQVLRNQQLVVVGESRAALKAVVSERLLQHLQSQALMVAPIVSEGNLLGFLSVESTNSRIWKDPEKQFVMAAARLLGVALPGAFTQENLHHLQLEQQLTTGLTQGIYGDIDWHQALAGCAQALQDRLSIQQFFVLLFNPDRNGYDLCFQHQTGKPRGVPLLWPCLDEVDWQMLERSPTPISIDNIRQNLTFTVWRPHLMNLGVQSILVGNVAPGNAPEGIVIITDRISRQWTSKEQQLLEALSRQIGVILHQWQLQRQLDQQQHIYESIQWGLQGLHTRVHIDQLEQTTVQHMLQLLQAATVFMVSWDPGSPVAKVTRIASQDNSVRVSEDYPIPVSSDAMINWAMQTDGILPLTSNELPDEVEAWFSVPVNSRILITALRTSPEHVVSAIVIAVSTAHNPWAEHHLDILKLLTSQLAWSRRHLRLVFLLHQQRQELERLNWYKNHRLEDCYCTLIKVVNGMTDSQQGEEISTPDSYQQVLVQLHALVASLETILNQEQWSLHHSQQTMPLISLINRLIVRLDPLLQSRQLWSKVHNESSLILGGDMTKLEMIIYDVMVAACQRSPIGGRIDIWCRTVNQDWFELSITDDGSVSPVMIEELAQGDSPDLLAPSLLDLPPGLHLAICQSLLRQLGGDITISVLEDGRTHSRFLLPRATHIDARKPSPLPTFDAFTPEPDPEEPI